MFKNLATFFRVIFAILLVCVSKSALATSCSFSWNSCGFNPNYTSYTVAMQSLGGSNTFANPQIEVNTSFTFGVPLACCSEYCRSLAPFLEGFYLKEVPKYGRLFSYGLLHNEIYNCNNLQYLN